MSSLRVLFVVVIGALLTSATPWGVRRAKELAFKKSVLQKNQSLNVICTHHKTGTFLMKHWLDAIRKDFEIYKWSTQKDAEQFYEGLIDNGRFTYNLLEDAPVQIVRRLRALGVRVRYLHSVREPMDAVVSAYQYHKSGQECHSNEMRALCHILATHNETIGLEAAADYMWPILVEMTALAKLFSVMDNAITVYLEEMKLDFSGNFERIIDFLYWPEGFDRDKVLYAAKKQQLHSSSSSEKSKHVSDPTQKPRLHRLLERSSKWAEKLRELAKELEAASPLSLK